MKLQKVGSALVLVAMLSFLVACKIDSSTETRLSAEGCDFRKAHWGDTMDIVKSDAVETLESTDHLMTGEVNILGYISHVEYAVSEEGLFGGVYSIDLSNIAEGEYATIYNAFAKQLSEEYGNPSLVIEDLVWWESSTTHISLSLSKEGSPSISILYIPKD